jgi:hypothetical protein
VSDTLKQQIEKRAYELFLARGGQHGYAIEDWVKAEKEILEKQASAHIAAAAVAPKLEPKIQHPKPAAVPAKKRK